MREGGWPRREGSGRLGEEGPTRVWKAEVRWGGGKRGRDLRMKRCAYGVEVAFEFQKRTRRAVNRGRKNNRRGGKQIRNGCVFGVVLGVNGLWHEWDRGIAAQAWWSARGVVRGIFGAPVDVLLAPEKKADQGGTPTLARLGRGEGGRAEGPERRTQHFDEGHKESSWACLGRGRPDVETKKPGQETRKFWFLKTTG